MPFPGVVLVSFWIVFFVNFTEVTMALRPTTLFVATATDSASLNIARNLLAQYNWTPIKDEGDRKIMRCNAVKRNIYLWVVNQSMLSLNYVNQMFAEELKTCDTEEVNDITDVFFVSRHAAASGTVSLTVHPIGIPWLQDPGRFGGLPGRCSPPNHHIGGLYRNILKHVTHHKMDTTFQVTLEATHHGPFVEVPTCFVEIGSSEAEWSNAKAGQLWARCIGQYFGLPKAINDKATTTPSEEASEVAEESIPDEFVESCDTAEEIVDGVKDGVVCLQIGGGHYVPKMNDMARFGPKIYVAHALATYTLSEAFETGAIDDNNIPRWRNIIQEAIDSTKISFPTSSIACYVDKRAFLLEQRNNIASVLDENGIQWGFSTGDVKKLLKEKSVDAL